MSAAEQRAVLEPCPGARRGAHRTTGMIIFWRSNMNAIDRIKSQLASAPVVLYMKGTPDFPQCGFSAQTVGALRACKAEFAHVNIFEDPEVRDAAQDAIPTGRRSRSSM